MSFKLIAAILAIATVTTSIAPANANSLDLQTTPNNSSCNERHVSGLINDGILSELRDRAKDILASADECNYGFVVDRSKPFDFSSISIGGETDRFNWNSIAYEQTLVINLILILSFAVIWYYFYFFQLNKYALAC